MLRKNNDVEMTEIDLNQLPTASPIIKVYRHDIKNVLKNFFDRSRNLLDIFFNDPPYIEELLFLYRNIKQEELNQEQLFNLAKILLQSEDNSFNEPYFKKMHDHFISKKTSIKMNGYLLPLKNIFGVERLSALRLIYTSNLYCFISDEKKCSIYTHTQLNMDFFRIICNSHADDVMNIAKFLLKGWNIDSQSFDVILHQPQFIPDVQCAIDKLYGALGVYGNDDNFDRCINYICRNPGHAMGLAKQFIKQKFCEPYIYPSYLKGHFTFFENNTNCEPTQNASEDRVQQNILSTL